METKKTILLSPSLPSKLSQLQKTRSLSFFPRNFRKIQPGSLRGSIFTFLKLSLGIGFFTIPHYIKDLGILNSLIIITINAFLTYFTFKYIFEASLKTGKNNLQEIIKDLLGDKFYFFSIFTLFLDFFSSILVEFIVSWNLLQYLLFFLGFFKKNWILNEKTLKFDENNTKIFYMRFFYFSFFFVISIKKLLNDKLEKLRYISFFYILTILSLIIFLIFQMPLFHKNYSQKNQIKITYFFTKPSFLWLQAFFAILGSYNSQTYVLQIKKELFLPTKRRLNKIAKIGIISEFLIFSIMGVFCYFSLGDYFTPDLILLRKPLLDFFWIEIFMKILIFGYFFFMVLGLPLNNVSFKNLIIQFFFERRNKRISFFWRCFISLGPFWGISCFAIFWPDIIEVFSIFGMTIWSLNGVVFPLLFKIKLLQKEKGSESFIKFLYILITIILTTGIIGFFHNINS